MSTKRRVFIGNLSERTSRRDLIRMFERYGEVESCDIKSGFAFIEFRSPTAAEDAIYNLHRKRVDGRSLAVEYSHSKGPRGGGGRDFGGSGYRDSYRDRRDTGSRYFDSRRDGSREPRKESRSKYSLKVKNLPSSMSWQDLKDYARKHVGSSVVRTDVWSSGDGNAGIIEFSDKEDFEYALDKLDGKVIDGKEIQVSRDDDTRNGDSRRRSRSNSSRRRSKSVSRHRKRKRSSSRSRSSSYSRSQSRSYSKSRSKSPRKSMSRSKSVEKPKKAEKRSRSVSSSNESERRESKKEKRDGERRKSVSKSNDRQEAKINGDGNEKRDGEVQERGSRNLRSRNNK